MATKIKLIAETYTTDALGQQIATETYTEVFCDMKSISANEFKNAGLLGLEPAYMLDVWLNEYNGEQIAEVNGKRYGIYRVYYAKNRGKAELYLEKKAGVI